MAEANTSTLFAVRYRCVCGVEFLVRPDMPAECPECHRNWHYAAISQSMAATITIDINKARHTEDGRDTDFDLHKDLLIGHQLDHFQLEERLGKGGMGSVYRALDTSLQRYVAVKLLHSRQLGDDQSDVDKVLQEAITQARLNHPNVVTIYYVSRDEENPFFAMELLDGHSLQEALRNGPLPIDDILNIASQVVGALEHATRFGIVHGDIKPANLLRSRDGTIKLSDFGLASFLEAEPSSSLSGTPNYLAPEILDGSPNSVQSDMYALGVTLFELTFGRLPFQLRGNTLRERLQTHCTADVEFPELWPKAVPVLWRATLARLLEKDPNQRYQDYEQLREDLDRLRPMGSTPAGLPVRFLAYAIDQALLLLPTFGLAWVAQYYQARFPDQAGVWITPVISLMLMLIPLTLLTFIWLDIRTPGRWLSQLRVVDRFGLPLGRSKRVTREFLRNIPLWMVIFSIVLDLGNVGWLGTYVDIVTGLFILADVACMFLSLHRRTLHDYTCDSKVVLAEGA
ncbi:MAG: protein kinase domain-containing protein [Aureliella sp.]